MLARCLRKDPRMRLRDIGDARLEIVESDATQPVATPTGGRLWPVWLTVTALVALITGGVIGALWRQPAASPTETRWTGVRLSAPPTVMNPLLSPDGQLLAFQTTVDGQSQIAVMNPEAGTWRVLTSDRSRGLITTHDWAPDGSRIFFDRQTDTLNGVFSVPSLGGEERLVLENAGLPNALPNGDLLVVRVNAQRQMQLHRFSPSTGRVDPLPAVPDAAASDDVVVVSPDGRRAYFFGQPLQNAGAPPAFFELDLQTGTTTPLAADVTLRRPIALGIERSTGDVLLGGLEGDVFQLVRVAARSNVAPRTILNLIGVGKFDIDAQGRVYIATRVRPQELFALPPSSVGTAKPQQWTLSSVPRGGQQTIAPLPDGNLLIGSRAADRDRILVVKVDGEMSRLVEGDEETRAPVTAVGQDHAAVMMGSSKSPDIAIVNTADGRLVRRFKAPSATIFTMGASPDGRTLYYTDAGSVWSLPAEGGTPAKIGAGDSLTVDPDTGDLIVKLDEGARSRLVRMKPQGGDVEPIPVHGVLRLIPNPLMPGAVRRGRLVLAVASVDSWFWHPATLDLKTGIVTKLTETTLSDFHFVTWRADGVPIGFAYGLDSMLWRFTPRAR
jgi:eukaryotic-like serine/threonine-protein kinase